MKKPVTTFALIAAALSAIAAPDVIDRLTSGTLVLSKPASASQGDDEDDDGQLSSRIERRREHDVEALQKFRPGYRFWRHVFSVPDGSIIFGSASDGRPLVAFPAAGDWHRTATWYEPALASTLEGHLLPRALDERRDYVERLLEDAVGPVLHNATRGRFVEPGLQRYGRFLGEWGAIYERFGVPAEIGLAQALLESGFEGARRSEADAVGLCQWLEGNWKQLDRLDPAVIEAKNQTTQSAYCAAYLSVLATKYGSYIPALSEHHAGGTNIARVLITGDRLDGDDAREQYLIGADFARDLRTIAHDQFNDVYGSYGPRSYRYAEMTFGNAAVISESAAAIPQTRIYAMRTTRSLKASDIARRTGLSLDEIRRHNPALVTKVPAGATLYLPVYDRTFGADVAFWHKPATAEYAALLNEFVRLDASWEEWGTAAFEPTLREFERRFRATRTEEGTVMATVLAYVISESSTSGRREILARYTESDEVRDLFERGVRAREAVTQTR